jgi:hypothetical protein
MTIKECSRESNDFSGSTHMSLSCFPRVEAFQHHTDQNLTNFEKVVCLILDINLKDGSGIELRSSKG